MYCRGNSGDRWLRRCKASQGAGVLVFLIVALALHGCFRKQAPWFGRDRNLPRAPISILTGPVDWRVGIRGVLELQMPKAEVEKHLGKPLVEAMATEEALQQGLDPEDVKNYFYGGAFAWVEYDVSGKVQSIVFDMKSLKERMETKQSLLLIIRDKPFLVSQQTDREAIVRFMQSVGQTVLEHQSYAIVVRFQDGRAFVADFDASQRLERIAILE